MFSVVKFMFVFAVGFSVVGIISIAWPRISTRTRPLPLESVHDLVKNTPLGTQTREVLGISDSQPAVPIDMNVLAGQAVTSVTSAIEEKAKEIIVRQAVLQLYNQIDKLNPQEKLMIKELMCQPESSGSSR